MFQKIQPIIVKLTGAAKRYSIIIFIIIFGALYGYLVYTAGQQAELEPSQKQISDAYTGISRPQLDAAIADKLRSLESSNVDVQTIFNDARNNPFSE